MSRWPNKGELGKKVLTFRLFFDLTPSQWPVAEALTVSPRREMDRRRRVAGHPERCRRYAEVGEQLIFMNRRHRK
jgi:hypothetical protein